jgi:hypothetical protein
MTLGPIDDSGHDPVIGVAVTARIGAYLQRYRDEALVKNANDYDLDYGTGGEEFVDIVSGDGKLAKALTSAQDISDQSKPVAAILGLLYGLLPIPALTISGAFDPPEGSDAGVTLSLQNGAKQAGAVMLSVPAEGDKPAYTDYTKLAQPAAIWVQYAVSQLLEPNEDAGPDDPASFALLREGLNRQNEGQIEAAELAYEQAVALNHRNWAARVNLASLRARDARPGEAIATVRNALVDMWEAARPMTAKSKAQAGSEARSLPDNANYFRLAYQLAAIELNAAVAGHDIDIDGRGTSPATLLAKSASDAKRVAKRAEVITARYRSKMDEPRRIIRWKKRSLTRKEDRLRRFLEETVIPSS